MIIIQGNRQTDKHPQNNHISENRYLLQRHTQANSPDACNTITTEIPRTSRSANASIFHTIINWIDRKEKATNWSERSIIVAMNSLWTVFEMITVARLTTTRTDCNNIFKYGLVHFCYIGDVDVF